MTAGAWAAVVSAVLLLTGTLTTAVMARRAQHESTRTTEAGSLLHSQVEFIDRLTKQGERQEKALTACRAVIARQEADLERCRDRAARLDDALATMRSVVVEQITAAATASGLEPGATRQDEETELAAVRQFLEHMQPIDDTEETT